MSHLGKIRLIAKAQSTAEYAILLAIVAAAIIAMQVYVRRGIQGRIRDLADQISPEHYEPKQTESSYTTTQDGITVSTYDKGISRTYQDGSEPGDSEGKSGPEYTQRSGHETVYPEEQK